MNNGVIVVIPALNPGKELQETVAQLEAAGLDDIVIVNDGSDPRYYRYFPREEEHRSLKVLSYRKNRGKGAALKQAFHYILQERRDAKGVVTADSDGQHGVRDILACVEKMFKTGKVVLGCRDFSLPEVPKRSRFGNRCTTAIFRLLCGMKISDTQTGLRAIPIGYLPKMLRVKGDRYEYETNMLIAFKQYHIPYCEQRIHTVYVDNNSGSHFRPIRDSLRVYRFLAGYLLLSGASSLVDIIAFAVLYGWLPGVTDATRVLANLGARVLSSLFNFTVNKKHFNHKGNAGKTMVRYYAVAIPQLILSMLLQLVLAHLFGAESTGWSTVIKIIVDIILFFVSFRIQQNWVFADERKKPMKKAKKRSGKPTVGCIVRRSLLCLVSVVLMLVVALYTVCFTIARGPSETVRNALVLSAMQASATKWVPGLFLDSETVDGILNGAKQVQTEVVGVSEIVDDIADEWDNAVDGMLYFDINGPTYKGYMLIIKDPSRVTVGISTSDFSHATRGARFYEIAEKYQAQVVMNAGEFSDIGGVGSGATPMGITFSDGNLVWNDGATDRTYIGFDQNNTLIVRESMTLDQAKSLGMRDMVAFQNNNVLIERDGDAVKIHNKPDDTGTSQRTAIGQRADGSVIFFVTDGRTASSLGATPSDVVGVMLEYGAVSAAMLDGGSSTMLYYRDYPAKLGIDTATLDEYQRMGLLNRYKAFTTPRTIPTWFIVR